MFLTAAARAATSDRSAKGMQVTIDHDLIMWLTKDLGG